MNWTAVATGLIAVLGVVVGEWLAKNREQKAFERAARQARRDRLHRLYVPVVRAALAVNDAALRLRGTLGRRDQLQPGDDVSEILKAPMEALTEAIGPLQLELETDRVLSAWSAVWEAYGKYEASIVTRRLDRESVSVEELRVERESIESRIGELIKAAREHLAQIDASAGQTRSDVSQSRPAS